MKKITKTINNILTLTLFLLIFISSTLIIILKTTFNIEIYKNYYSNNNSNKELGLEYNELINYTENLFNYLKNTEILNDKWFSKKDILHMIDVKYLYNFSIKIIIVTAIISLIFLIILKIINKKNTLKNIINLYNLSFVMYISIIIIITIIALLNFNYFWIKFHKILFSNDLWILSPTESNLIKMFPEEFFFLLVKKIIINIFIYFTILTISTNIIKKYLK